MVLTEVILSQLLARSVPSIHNPFCSPRSWKRGFFLGGFFVGFFLHLHASLLLQVPLFSRSITFCLFVVCLQDHDYLNSRRRGMSKRLTRDLPLVKLLNISITLSPFLGVDTTQFHNSLIDGTEAYWLSLPSASQGQLVRPGMGQPFVFVTSPAYTRVKFRQLLEHSTSYQKKPHTQLFPSAWQPVTDHISVLILDHCVINSVNYRNRK